jgi:16S rRNA (cytidine1402-2'-O)-methyltransferase
MAFRAGHFFSRVSSLPGGEEETRLASGDIGESFFLYESPFRIVKLLEAIADILPERRILLGREMTKMHEEYLEGSAGEILEILRKREKVLGEFSVLVSAKKKS